MEYLKKLRTFNLSSLRPSHLDIAYPPWRSALALSIIVAMVLAGVTSEPIWGLVFIAIVLPALKSGTTFFLDEVRMNTYPILYWSINIGLLMLGIVPITIWLLETFFA